MFLPSLFFIQLLVCAHPQQWHSHIPGLLLFNLQHLELHRKESACEWWRMVTGEDAPFSRNHLQLTYPRSPLLGLPIFPSKSQPWFPVHPRSNLKPRLGLNPLWTPFLPPLRSWVCILEIIHISFVYANPLQSLWGVRNRIQWDRPVIPWRDYGLGGWGRGIIQGQPGPCRE